MRSIVTDRVAWSVTKACIDNRKKTCKQHDRQTLYVGPPFPQIDIIGDVYKRQKLAVRAVLSADAGLLVIIIRPHRPYYVRRCGLLLLTE